MSRPARRVPASTPVYRVALVSGANRGLGFEVARQLSEHGMTVLLGARDPDQGLHAARKLAGAPGEVVAVQLDVTQQEQVDTLARWIDVTYGRLDVLVNNAGGYYDHDALASDGDLTRARGAMEAHLFGSWRLTSAMLPLMRRHGYGRIVNVSSGCAASTSNGRNCVAYRASKSALNAYTRTLASELEGTGIAVNAVCPGWVATDLGGPGGRPVGVGAAGVVWAASLATPAPTGRFFRDGEQIAW
jgi:NAD(P)-dependent dehydrogenase (short-subunit alcohol dehydrogenase family)